MRKTEIREIVGWVQAPSPQDMAIEAETGMRHISTVKRTIKVRVPADYPLPDAVASAIFQSSSMVTVVWEPDILLTAREMRPDSKIYEALHVVCTSQGTNTHGPMNSFVRVFGLEDWPAAQVIVERPPKAPATDFNVVIRRDF